MSREFAAIDLGSNSFHMVVAREEEHGIVVVDRVREMVRLASGLDDKNRLDEVAAQRALDCLSRFGQRIHNLSPENVRAVGTNTLRKAKNSAGFLGQAEQALGFPIDIISGLEEARLIYLGVSQTLQEDRGRRLVVDIGGGSTEIIIGEQANPLDMESLYMGCVSASRNFFGNGKLGASRMRKAILAASVELEPHVAGFVELGWADAIGTSGTARAIERVVRESGWSEGGITRASLERLVDAIAEAGHVDKLKLTGLGERRQPVFAGGVAVLTAIFRELRIDRMRISDGALREGALYDLVGRVRHDDRRDATVQEMIRRHHIDLAQAQRVQQMVMMLFRQVSGEWELSGRDGQLLGWAAMLHEIGLMIAHTQYHKHGGYMLANMDLPGFSRQEQATLSVLVRLHRRKFQAVALQQCASSRSLLLQRMVVLLRLAVLFNRSRVDHGLPGIGLQVNGDELVLQISPQWLEDNPLTLADLEQEQAFLAGSEIALQISP